VVEGVEKLRRKIDRNEMLRAVHQEASKVLREGPAVDMKKAKRPGDPDALRGVPIPARHVGGTMAHTNPERETVERLTRQSL
jgi:hypothetical protein